MGQTAGPENTPDPITGRLPTISATTSDKSGKAKKKRSGGRGGLSRGAGIIAALSVGGASLAGVYVWNQVTAPDTVEVFSLTTDVAANQMLTADDLTSTQVQVDLAPPNSLTREDLTRSRWFARVSLPAGTVIQDGIVDTTLRTIDELPEGTEPVSFTVAPENAVAGRVQAGSYVNLFAVVDGVSTLVQSKLYILNAQPDVNAVASGGGRVENTDKPGPDNPVVYGGIPSLYTAAVTPEQAARLFLLEDTGATFYMTLTSPEAPDPGLVVVTEGGQLTVTGPGSADDSAVAAR